MFDLFLIGWVSLAVEAQLVLRTPHTEDLEAVDLRDELRGPSCSQLWVGLYISHTTRSYLQEDVWKACPKVGTVDVQLFLPWHVDILALGTVHFDPAG